MTRAGSWMETVSGVQFWPLDPRRDEVRAVDIAWALANKCRYGGHVRRFFSVAEHSLLIAEYLTRKRPDAPWLRLPALLHDAAETYLPDVIRPVKRHLPGFEVIESRVEKEIFGAFGLEAAIPVLVKDADSRIILNEAAALMPSRGDTWGMKQEGIRGLHGTVIRALSPHEAFAALFAALQEASEGYRWLPSIWRSAELAAELVGSETRAVA